ncbi:asparagine synthase-related protein [Aurantiacibacter spongiae]|uniref:asparagine synthase (glutamine-hydrolyzing) n=1 Tax=Aurantiacibacter spongiae TaxID=2488860 RepID=A0A3N5CU29_9SPHN|nr:asparagine synthetase B family protein [Aurantiacibacter spongiae]RPF70920.1 hypothetical protein EG799_04265 [Aurantiacibacter spongiae]
MSAISAIFQRDGAPVAKDDVDRMAASLRIHAKRKLENRRLDNFGLTWGQAALFTPHDRFDQQPIMSGNAGFVFSGFLTYRGDLENALGIESQRAKTMSDGALAHRAWNAWGREALPRLEGDWAFIACDAERQTLFAATSPLMAPSLVYHVAPDRFVMASAPKGIFALPDIPREVDEQHVADALTLNLEDAEQTFFKGISLLCAGHWIAVSRSAVEKHRWYEVGAVEPVRFVRDEEYVEAADALTRDAVDTHMRAVRTPACTVSAGLDSSTVAVYALDALHRDVHDLTDPLLGFTHVPGKDWDGRVFGKSRIGDESGPVKALAGMYPDFEVEFVDSEGMALDTELDKVIRLAEMPLPGWNNLHWSVAIRQRVLASGRNVMLGGQSGNRTLSFSNRSIYPQLFREGRWAELHAHLRAMTIGQGMAKRYWRYVFQPQLPPSAVKALARFRGDAMHMGWRGFSAINPDYAAQMQVDERAEAMGRDDSYGTIRSARELRDLMTMNGNRAQNSLMRMALQSAHGLHGRDPLGDRRLTEFCYAIPEEQFMRPGQDRWLIRRMMADRLPREILTAPRGRQAADWHARFTKDIDRYRAEIERAAEDPVMAGRFDIPRLRKLLDTWPDKTPLDASDHPDYVLAMVGIGRMIGMSRFINWVEGKN